MRGGACVIVSALLLAPAMAYSQSGGRGSYPTVIGSTGRAYGPTQAEYQYRQQYGRPSPQYQSGGIGTQYVNGYPGTGGGRSGWNSGYGGYGVPFVYPVPFDPFYYPTQGYSFAPSTAHYGVIERPGFFSQPVLSVPTPSVLQTLPATTTDPLHELNAKINAHGLNGDGGGAPFPTIARTEPLIQESSLDAKQKSFRIMALGDTEFHRLNYYAASEQYRKAVNAAKDLADPRGRLAISLAARSRFLEAVDQLKLATHIDPGWPQRAETLDQIFGAENTFEKHRVKRRIAEWTLEDARDPNRLFLLGAIMALDGEPKAETLLNTAILLDGREQHLVSFLEPRDNTRSQVPDADAGAIEVPPIPMPPDAHVPGADNNADTIPMRESEIPALPPLPDGTNAAMNGPRLPAPSID